MYRLASPGVIRLSDGRHIRPDKSDQDWLDYQAWYRAGGRPEPAPAQTRWPDLDTARAEVRAAINAERDRREATSFPYLGRNIDSDPRSVQRINTTAQAAQAALAVGQAFAVEWTCADNSTLTLDAAGAIGMPVALAINAQVIHLAARAMKDWADTASMAELEAFDATTAAGWPT
jgi:hypothetical protein